MKKLVILTAFIFFCFIHVTGQITGDFRSKTGGSGNWSDYKAWETYNGSSWVSAISGQLPASTSSVEIKAGDAMVINATSLNSGNLTVNGSLTYNSTTVSVLSVFGNVVVSSTGSFTSPSSGTVIAHNLYIGGNTASSTIGGNLVVDGVFNMNIYPTAGVVVTFVGTPNNTISGNGTINFYSITIDKGADSYNSILEVVNSTMITVPDANATINQRLNLSYGTFKLSSASNLTLYYGSPKVNNITGRLWMNNAGATIHSVGSGTSVSSDGTVEIDGMLQIDAGTFSFGAGNSCFLCNGNLKLGGPDATLNIYGYFLSGSTSIYAMSDGNINIYPQIGSKNVPANSDLFQFTGINIDFTGGTMTFVDPNPNAGNGVAINIQSGTCNCKGSTFRFGNGISDADGTANGFLINSGGMLLGNVIVNNAPASIKQTRIVKLTANSGIAGNLTINSGTANQYDLNNFTLTCNGNITNYGKFITDGHAGNGLVFGGSDQQVISGSGVFSTNVNNLTINNSSNINPSVDLQIPLSVSNSLTLTDGTLGSSNNSIFTMGKSSASSTFNITRSGGMLALIPVYAFGGVNINAVTYNEPTSVAGITTGYELPPNTTIGLININNSGGVILDKPVICGTLSLTSGILSTTRINTITVSGLLTTSILGGSALSYVNGPLIRYVPSNASSAYFKFPVGKSAYRLFEFPNLTTGGTGNSSFTVEAFDSGPYPGNSGTGISTINTDKYWTISAVLNQVTITPTTSIRLNDTGLDVTNRIGQSNNVSGTFNSLGGITSGATTITSVNPLNYSAIASGTFFRIGVAPGIQAGTYAIGPASSYSGYAGTFNKLTDAISAITSVPISGNLIFEFQADYVPSVETYPISLNSNIVSRANSTITFRPSANVSSIINFSYSGTVINNAGADYISFDGRNGGTGANQYLQFTDNATSNAPSTVIISNDALYNQYLYCIIKGNTTIGNGILTVGSATNGNNFITIDHCDFNANGIANNCIYSSGIASNATIINNNFFDFRNGAGINLAGGSDNAIIDNNSFYQTTTYNGFAGTTSGIIVTGGGNVRISNNNIGGSGSGLTGIWTLSTSPVLSCSFTGINATSLTKNSKVYNNKIQNIDWKSTVSTFTGINISGSVNVGTDGSNYIGNNSGNDNIKITYYLSGVSQVNGIIAGGSAVIENNIIGSITSQLSGVTNTGACFTGINSSGTGIINHNTVGSSTISNSINIASQSTTGNSQNVLGINSTGTTATITNNTISNMSNGSTVATGTTRGILLTGLTSSAIISSNDIHSISTAQPVTSTGVNASLDGINLQGTSGTAVTITGNTIYDLINTSSLGICVNGILYSSSTTSNNKIDKNYIHSIKTFSNSAIQNGLNLYTGGANVQNNVIRLGIDKNGNSITGTAQINGILKTSAQASNFYFNTVYVGGSSVDAGTVKTYALNFSIKSSSAEDIRNNIFVNMRTNTIANKLNYVILLPVISNNWTSDYNIYFASTTDGKLSYVGGTDLLILKSLQDSYIGADLHSGYGDPLLTHPADPFITMDLKPGDTTPAESTGIAIPGITDDFSGVQRISNTPTDIGAYSGNFAPPTAVQDIFAPSINYNNLGNGSSTTNRLTANFASITDNIAGLNVSPGFKPRLYYKIQTNANAFVGNTSADNGWKWVEAIGTTTPFDFNIDYSILYGGPVVLNSVIQYFVVAQDLATIPFVTFNPAKGAVGTSVTPVGMTAPTNLNSYTIVPSLPVNINVGTGQTYTTLTGNGGVFATINAGTASANIVVTIKSDITEPGIKALNFLNEEGPNAGSITLTIQSDGISHVISGTAVAPSTPMISIAGTKRLTIDGGAGKLLTFRNTNSTPSNTGAVFQYDNSSQNDILTNCIIESNSTNSAFGAIKIGTNGTNIVTIKQNDIRNSRGGTSGSPIIGIYSYSTGNTLNIVNNNIYNLINANSYGMYLNSVSNGCTINGNSIYMESGFSTVGPFTGILITYSNSHLISGNYIGGSAPYCGGTDPFIVTGSTTFTGINSNYTDIPIANILGNTIQNIKMSSTSAPVFYGINNNYGPIIITGNTIGSSTVANSIQIAGTGTSAGIIQSYAQPLNSCNIDKNTIANISLTNTSGIPTFSALKMTGGVVRMNNIYNIGSIAAALTPTIYGINNTDGVSVNEFSNNVIAMNGSAATAPLLYGFYDNSTKGTTGFYYNTINLYGTASGTTSTFAFNRSTDNTYISNNNIFVNSRTGGSGSQYALYSLSTTGYTSDYNDLYATGTTPGHWGIANTTNDVSNLTAWKAVTLQDNNSISVDPLFTSPTNLLPVSGSPVSGSGTSLTNITNDITGTLRNAVAPTIGAYELVCTGPTNGGIIGNDQLVWIPDSPAMITDVTSANGYSGVLEYKWQSTESPYTVWSDISTSNSAYYQPDKLIQTTKFKRLARTTCMKGWSGAVESNIVTITINLNKWKGTTSFDWNDPTNWTQNLIPAADANIVFDDATLNNCKMDQDHSVTDITDNQPAYHLITNGKTLKVKGNLNFSNGAQIDATTPNSTIEFSGSTTQHILSNTFKNNELYNLIIDNNAGVYLDTDIIINNILTINMEKYMIIPTGKMLNVEGTINNFAGTSGLIIKASQTGEIPNGSLIYHNDTASGSTVQATVEMFTKASKVNEHYRWQFFGIPIKSVQANPTFSGSYVRELHENNSDTIEHWEQLNNESILKSFIGYEITQDTCKIINFKGDLVNSDYLSGSLSFTPTATFKGQHLIGNSYMSAINIKNDEIPGNSLMFGDGMEKTVYLFNTGSEADWSESGSNNEENSDTPGQYLSVPQENAGSDILPASIPSMQAFLVKVITPGPNATISIPYNSTGTIVKNTTLLREKNSRKIYTRIDVKGSNSIDHMWIFTNQTCSRGYDNGWDGFKMLGSVMSPQIYAMEADGDYQVNSVDDINNSYIGFRAGIDSTYTMTFIHQNKDPRYNGIYLMDLIENKIVEITASGSQYSFKSTSGNSIEKRFKIIASVDGSDITTRSSDTLTAHHSLTVFSSQKTILVKNQSDLKGDLYLYDMTGRLIQKSIFSPNEITLIPTQLPVGTYVSKAITLKDEVTAKLIISE